MKSFLTLPVIAHGYTRLYYVFGIIVFSIALHPLRAAADVALLTCSGTSYSCKKSESFESCLSNATVKGRPDTFTLSIDTKKPSVSVTLFVETHGKLDFTENEFFIEAPVSLGADPMQMTLRVSRINGEYSYMLSKTKNSHITGAGIGSGNCSLAARKF